MQNAHSLSVLTDEELVMQYHHGDNSALADLLVRYAPLADRLIAKHPALGADAEDAKQELLVSLVRAVASYQQGGGASFRTYLNQSMENALKNLMIHHQTGKHQILTQALSLDDLDEERLIRDFSVNPEDEFMMKEHSRLIREFIAETLSELEQQVLVYFLADYSYEEIAALLSSTPKSVDNALQRIRKKLRVLLSKSGEIHSYMNVSK